MRTREDIQHSIAVFLTDLRLKKGLSKTKMAELVGVDKHTWLRWETGASAPSIADVIMMHEILGENILRPLLDTLYPSTNILQDPIPVEDMRKNAAEYYLEEASDHKVRIFDFMMSMIDKKELNTQIEAFCAMEHMPLQYRYFISEQIYIYYMMARRSGELVHTDISMPNIEEFQEGLKKIQKSAFDQLKSIQKGEN